MYKFNNNIKVAMCEKDLVILDTINDTYSIINDIEINSLNKFLKGIYNSELQLLLDENLLFKSNSGYDQVVQQKLIGFFEQRWITPTVSSNAKIYKIKFEILIEILKINSKLQKLDFESIGRALSSVTTNKSICKNKELLMKIIISNLNNLFILDISDNKCLAYSFILSKILKTYGINAKLLIGVRTRPFFSHAWVEVDDKVISDVQLEKDNLAIILEYL
ncbi:lasso peptide biosynthesis B2 protein [Acinetobacter soli]|uniref:Microcin J25-processing protein mcjB n=1 Tax=Acinetobacter soli TaxID=487316 RepID=A0A1P8EN82_9GAMM|nr:lasso peptide biosynthesis B2 protein [Acinetobacter soli]APV37700.1 microcin J25-processing protein mcjB [Acinetobacter soli]